MMEAVAATSPPPDEALAACSRTGDRNAFKALYEPHFEGLFDFALRVVRDRAAAAFIVHGTFERAGGSAQTPEHLKAWLYGIARTVALEGTRYRRRPSRWTEETREGLDFTKVDARRLADPSAVVFDRELIELVWNTAVALDLEDYSLLDLHVRRDLGAPDLARYLGLDVDALTSKLAGLHASFDNSILAVLLATRVRRSCAALEQALSGFGRKLASPATRRAVQRHLLECGACRESKRNLASPTELLASFTPMPAHSGLQEQIIRRFSTDQRAVAKSNLRRGFLLRHPVPTPGG